MVFQALAALLALGSFGFIGWGVIEGPATLIYLGILLFVVSAVLYNSVDPDRTLARIKKRPRPWSRPLTDEERSRYGSRLVFEPTCLKPNCSGPVVELVNERPPAHPGPFLGKFDSELPSYYVQGPAYCASCKQNYMYTIIHGTLSLSTPDAGNRLSQVFRPL